MTVEKGQNQFSCEELEIVQKTNETVNIKSAAEFYEVQQKQVRY